MTKTTTMPEAPATVGEQIDYAIEACADYGIQLQAKDAKELLMEIDDPEMAAQHLEELAKWLRLVGAALGREAA